MDAKTRIATIRDYAAQIHEATGVLDRALTELNKNLAALPVAETINADELARREKELAERERDLAERLARVRALIA